MQMIKLKVINNRKLWICCLCIVTTTLLCFLSPFPGGDPDVKETVLKVWLSTDREQLLQMDEMASIYSVAAGFRNMEWFIVLLPLVAVVPGIFEFSEVWFGGNFYLTALRGTKKQFTGKCLLESAWKAFLCVGSGIVLYIVLVAVKFLPLDAYVNDVSESMIAMVYGETLLQRIGWLLLAIVHTGLLAAVFAITALVLTVLWGDSFFAISSLVLLEYFSKNLHPVMWVLYMSDTNLADCLYHLKCGWWSSFSHRIIYFMIVHFSMRLEFLILDMQYSSVCGWVELPYCFTGR